MISLFGHSIAGPSFMLLYLAILAALVIFYWLSQKLNGRGRKAVRTTVRDVAVPKKTDSLQKKRFMLRRVLSANEVIHGRNRTAYHRPDWPQELDKKLSQIYVLNPLNYSVNRRIFASSKDTREAWLDIHGMASRQNNRATVTTGAGREPQQRTKAEPSAQTN